MGELIAILGRLDSGVVVAFLLTALLVSLRYIGNGLAARLARAETRIEELESCKHKHATSLAVIKARLEIVEDNADHVD